MNWTNKDYRDIYENLPEDRQKQIDAIYDSVKWHCFENRIKLNFGDSAEDFVGAITKYLMESEEAK